MHTQPNESPGSILVVDDIPENLNLLMAILMIEDYDVAFATNGKEALRLARQSPPDIILLDVSMPEMDGFEVCRILKQSPETAPIPVIFLTALNDSQNLVEGFKAGGSDYLTKPYNADELLVRVRNHLELKFQRERVERFAREQERLNLMLNQQKAIIEQKNTDLLDSLAYAKIIQQSFLPSQDKLHARFRDSFLHHQAKDIIGGDFYYLEPIGHKTLVVVADCTGHGVPGALLSMLGTSLLNQIVLHEKTTAPDRILCRLNLLFSQTLAQHDNIRSSEDGMDAAICLYDPTTQVLEFAGARRPMYLVRDGQAFRHKGCTQAIGGMGDPALKRFELSTFQLRQHDAIVLLSDGMADQFGGPAQKKFGTKRLKELLASLSGLSAASMGQGIVEQLLAWQGGCEQVDDILMLAFKVGPFPSRD